MENEKINYKIAIVEWVEVQTSLENIHIDDLKEIRAPMNVSVGFLLRKTNKNITIGFSLNSEKWIKQYQIIPRDLIKSLIIMPKNVYQDFGETKETIETRDKENLSKLNEPIGDLLIMDEPEESLGNFPNKGKENPLNKTLENVFPEK